MKRLLLFTVGILLVLVSPVSADPGSGDEVEVIVGDCDDGTTIVRAHNTTEQELGYVIRIDGRLEEQGTLAPDARVERTYDVPLGESRFFRIRLGLTGQGEYFSAEDTTDRTNCESPSETPSPTTPPPTTSTPPPPTVGGGGGSAPGGPTVGGISGTNAASPATLAFTGPEEDAPWLIAAMVAFLVVGTLALRVVSSRSKVTASNSDWTL
jgi:hypothetical protein